MKHKSKRIAVCVAETGSQSQVRASMQTGNSRRLVIH